MSTPVRFAVAVLAAGASSRFGRPKPLVRMESTGRPLLCGIVEEVCHSSAAYVGVVLGAQAAAIAQALRGCSELHGKLRILFNTQWREGMASSIRKAVAWASASPCEGLVVVLGDQPGLSSGHLERLAQSAGPGCCEAVQVASGYAGVMGAPAFFARSRFPLLSSLTGDRGAAELLRSDPATQVVPWAAGAQDIDTPEDLAACATMSVTVGGGTAFEIVDEDERRQLEE